MAEEVLSFVLGAFIGAFIFYFVGHNHGGGYITDRYKVELIKRGYGEYCPKTGEFAFIGECDEKSN
jgi:membrane protein DedA with SNARE-associated domain